MGRGTGEISWIHGGAEIVCVGRKKHIIGVDGAWEGSREPLEAVEVGGGCIYHIVHEPGANTLFISPLSLQAEYMLCAKLSQIVLY